MKKALAIILTFALLSCALVIPVNAVDDAENENWLYLDSFKEKYVDEQGLGAKLLCYEELYYCKDYKGDVLWAFVHAQVNMFLEEPVDKDFCRVHVRQSSLYVPFEYGYGVYDVKEDRFYDITEVCHYNETHTTPKYQSATDYFRQYYKPEKMVLGMFYNQYLSEYPGYADTVIAEYVDVYDELYYHYKGENYTNMDWILVRARMGDYSPVEMDFDLGNVNIFQNNEYYPFTYSLGVYDCRECRFYDIKDVWDSGKYEGLPEQFKRYYVPDNQFEDEFYDAYGWAIEDNSGTNYKELYHHYSETGAIDWVFVYGTTNCVEPIICYFQVGNRLINTSNAMIPFSVDYGIYDVEENKFYDITEVWKNEKYKEALKQFEKECDNGFADYTASVKIGDMNNDGLITVSDATYLQRCLAELEDYPVTPELQIFIDRKVGIDPKGYKTFDINDFYDVNEDGTVSIGDATKLQRISAEFDE